MKTHGREGMALPLTLIVLLVTGAIVAVSMYFIENMMTTTKMKTDGEKLVNAAIGGLEKGKQFILKAIDNDTAPRITSGDMEIISKLEKIDDREAFLKMLIVHEDKYSVDGVSVNLKIFDINYPLSKDIEFFEGIPPLISSTFTKNLSQSSLVQRQSYDQTNRGGGSPGEGFTVTGEHRAYLLRSLAELGTLSKTVEQAVMLKE